MAEAGLGGSSDESASSSPGVSSWVLSSSGSSGIGVVGFVL